jgi:hypothetical protein
MGKATVDQELTQISVPTKKIVLGEDNQKIEIVLRPFKQRHFSQAIAIIHKYFDQFNSVQEKYLSLRKEIIEKFSAEILKIDSDSAEFREEKELMINEFLNKELKELQNRFDHGMEIAKAILKSNGQGIGEDIKTMIAMSISKATKITVLEDSTERSPIDPDLDDLTWGECLVLLGSTVGLNMDFFAQNSNAMNLMMIMDDVAEPNQQPTAGEKSSVGSSKLTTATAK